MATFSVKPLNHRYLLCIFSVKADADHHSTRTHPNKNSTSRVFPKQFLQHSLLLSSFWGLLRTPGYQTVTSFFFFLHKKSCRPRKSICHCCRLWKCFFLLCAVSQWCGGYCTEWLNTLLVRNRRHRHYCIVLLLVDQRWCVVTSWMPDQDVVCYVYGNIHNWVCDWTHKKCRHNWTTKFNSVRLREPRLIYFDWFLRGLGKNRLVRWTIIRGQLGIGWCSLAKGPCGRPCLKWRIWFSIGPGSFLRMLDFFGYGVS